MRKNGLNQKKVRLDTKKVRFKDSVESKFKSGNAREAWQGLNIII